ncbi:MAG: NADH-quinone oxidoreductase subunit [Chloroflexi bacterium]|nr:NADH-quinone oxidoreductase subunit [Chloroflexota bacterium]
MTTALSTSELAAKINEKLPGSITEAGREFLTVKPEALIDVLSYLKSTPGLEFDYLTSIHAVDQWDYFELVYLLVSISHNHSFKIKTRCQGRDNLSVPSAVALYKSADFEEREIFDLMGIRFEGHPNLIRIFLWEGFQGYPLRKDYL